MSNIDEGHMTGSPTPKSPRATGASSLPALVLVFAVVFASSIGAVRDWTDVKIPAALAAAVCWHHAGRIARLVSACIGLFAGHLVFGAFIGVGSWPVFAWIIAGLISVGECVALVWILRFTNEGAHSLLPSRRLLRFLTTALPLALVGGVIESWLLGLVGVPRFASTSDVVFGVAIAACLAGITATRKGVEWLSSERLPGGELLAPLMVILVALVAVQVTRQLWSQRDDDRLEVLGRAVHGMLLANWAAESDILRSTARALDPAVVFEPTALSEALASFLDEDAPVSAALIARRPDAGTGPRVADIVAVANDPGVTVAGRIQDSEWQSVSLDNPVVIDRITEPLLVQSAQVGVFPDGSTWELAVAYALAELVGSVTDDVAGRFDDIAVEVLIDTESGASVLWEQDGVRENARRYEAGTLGVGERTLLVVVSPMPAFGSAGSTYFLVIGVELALGLLLCAVLVVGANAQFNMMQERRSRENLLEAALDATPGLSVVFDKDFRILTANRPVRQEFAGEIPGLDVARLFGLDTDSGRRRMVEDVLRTALSGETAHIEIAEDPTGDPFTSSSRMRIIELWAYPVTSPGGESVGFLHSVDATERRSLAMRSAQSERMESLGALAGGLAHDFNNLLFVTLGNLQLMAMNETVAGDEKLSKFVSRSMSAVERGAEITKSLLAVARSQPLEESAVSLSDLVKGILPLVRQALGSGRAVEVEIPDPHLQLMVDSGRLSSCILNLAFNSRDAMGPNGTLRIAAKLNEDSDMIELSVSDDGAGMPADVVSRAFEPFFTTKSPGSGTGLGLATVYAFAKQSGGTAFLESRIGSGTTVTLVLPRFTGSVVHHDVVAARRSGRRVVVADDEQALAEMVAAWLIDMGIDARFATSPKTALEVIEEFEPDVLVSDANFGEELDGIELARLGTAIVPDMAVVFMTGYSTSMRELQELGERVLAKPFSREDLHAALSPLIAEPVETSTSAKAKRTRGGPS